jgi:DNA invertase Pin-like site-specific DNA recombinase
VKGATLKRPGLRALLDVIRQDKIDVVVVHRLDRLSRSLFDLSELIPLLRVQRVELVSVTQQLDTQTPNGRLSLNLLTNFAEFEREIIGERTRDKVAATRGKGLWQGKGTPLGYGVDFEQRLVVIAHEADLVRDVFRQYLGLDSMTELMELLQRRRVKNKKWITRDAKPRGGQSLDRTAVYRILGNRMYIGEAYFSGEWHRGVYPPIVDIELWNQAHAKLAKRARTMLASKASRSRPVKLRTRTAPPHSGTSTSSVCSRPSSHTPSTRRRLMRDAASHNGARCRSCIVAALPAVTIPQNGAARWIRRGARARNRKQHQDQPASPGKTSSGK